MAYEKELATALAAVRKAGELCRNVQHNLVDEDTLSKKDRSPVTIADLGSQSLVCMEILRSLPDDIVVGEEDTSQLASNEEMKSKVLELVNEQAPGTGEKAMLEAIDFGGGEAGAGRFWTVDPIDGTKGFLRGDQYAVALGLVEEGRVVVGVLGCPNLPASTGGAAVGSLFAAVSGEGAFVEPWEGGERRSVRVDSLNEFAAARFCESVEKAHAAHDTHAKISAYLGIETPPYRIDSQCKYASVARGDASIYLRLPSSKGYVEKIWDHAAGVIVVEEAGGRVSDVSGRSLDFSAGKTLRNNTGVIATNGALHDRVLEAIAKVT